MTLSSFAYFVAIGATFPTLPLFVEGPLGGGNVSVGIAVGAFSATAVLLRPLMGGVGDRRGRRRLVLLGSAIVAVSIGGYALATSFAVLVVLRLLTGVGEAMFFVSAASAITDLAPDERRGEAISLFSLSLYGGFAVGPLIGEAIVGDGRFDAVWVVAAGFGFLAFLFGALAPETRFPEPGAGRTRLYHRGALVPGSVLLAGVWGFAGFSAFVALYARQLGLGSSGLVFLTYAGIVLLVRSAGARIPDRLGHARTARVAFALSATGLALIAGWGSVGGLFAGTLVFSVGQGLGFPALMSLAVGSAPPAERGAVVGTFTAFFDLAYGIGAVSLGAVADALGYRGTFGVASGAAVAGLVVLLVAPGFRRPAIGSS